MLSKRISQIKAQSLKSRSPQAFQLLKYDARTGEYFIPDALQDSTAKRERGKGTLKTWMDKVKNASGCDVLAHCNLELSHLDSKPLYSKKTISLARKTIEERMKENGIDFYIWKFERGRSGHTHAELLIPADSDLTGLEAVAIIESATDEDEIAGYFCKPADANACGVRPKDFRVFTPEQLADGQFQALIELARSTRAKGQRLKMRGLEGV